MVWLVKITPGEEPLGKIKVRELARRLTAIGAGEWTPGDVVTLAEAAGVPVGVSGSLDHSQVFVMLGQTDLPRRALMPQLMAAEWLPPQQPRPVSVPVARSSSQRAPMPRRRVAGGPGRVGQAEGGPIAFTISEETRQAAAAARPKPPPPRPLSWPTPLPRARRRRQPTAGPRPSVKVADLGALVRAILPLELRTRKWIWPDEAQPWKEEASRWAAAGFTDRSVKPWLATELSPADAGYLAARGVKPDVLGRLVPVPTTVSASGAATVRLLLSSRRLPVDAVYESLVRSGQHVPAAQPDLVLTSVRPVIDRPAPPPVVFSNPGDVDDPEPPVAPSRRRRTAKAHQHRGSERRNGPAG